MDSKRVYDNFCNSYNQTNKILKDYSGKLKEKDLHELNKSLTIMVTIFNEVYYQTYVSKDNEKLRKENKQLKDYIKVLKLHIKEYEYNIELNKFLDTIKNNKSDKIIFMFSGTTHIQEKKGNRPIKLSKQLINKNIPVFFSYWRWKNEEITLDNFHYGNLFQSPIDLTMKNIERILKYDFKDKKKIFIASIPYSELSPYLELLKINDWTLIYDIRDNWEEFNKVGMAKWYNKSIEKYYLSLSDMVTCVSNSLITKHKSDTFSDIKLLKNGLDPQFICSKKKDNLKENIIGYVGHLTDAWFDWKSFINITKKLPEIKFEIIGHSLPKDLPTLPPNVSYLGEKNINDIKDITKRWKGAMIPFKTNKLSEAVDPIKVYEYLAMKLKVVSFPMPEIENYPEVYIAKNEKQFIGIVKSFINYQFNSESTDEFLNYNTWDIRVNKLLYWIDELYK